MMNFKILNEKNEVVNIFEDQTSVTCKLLELLWSKYINKSNWITRIKYQYNYAEYQTITFYLDNKYKYIFEGIPSSSGPLDGYKIAELIKENKSNENK